MLQASGLRHSRSTDGTELVVQVQASRDRKTDPAANTGVRADILLTADLIGDRVADDAEILRRLQRATPQSGRVGLSFWADSALAGSMGIPSLLFGPSGHGAHAIDEWVSLNSLIRVYEILRKLILDF